ncbi:putative Appr-1-p processing protein [Paratrimastix pyriformis]|uniref:Appr-1-p processing protein n=1 Tax=Paratrimastix pyriformis TaxID=342808 RepID=A0ABQ8UTD7_9EUKA|nr:putative Appr-1-p processing protein [Paratrimastix pyriformis]
MSKCRTPGCGSYENGSGFCNSCLKASRQEPVRRPLYEFPIRGATLQIWLTDVWAERTAAIISLPGKIEDAIFVGAGPEIRDQYRREIQAHPPVFGTVACGTAPGKLSCKHILHCVIPDWAGGQNNEVRALREALTQGLARADDLHCDSIAIPSASEGNGYPQDLDAAVTLDAVIQFLNLDRPSGIRHVHFSLHHELTATAFDAEARRRAAGAPFAEPSFAAPPAPAVDGLPAAAAAPVPPAALDESRLVFSFPVGDATIEVRQGDLTRERTDAIVNPANEYLSHGAGVAGAIAKAGGPTIQAECTQYVRDCGAVAPGQVAMCAGAGLLPCKWVIHAVGPTWEDGRSGEVLILRGAVEHALEYAASLPGCRSIAIPAISSGIFGFPKPLCAAVLIDAAIRFLQSPARTLKCVRFTNLDVWLLPPFFAAGLMLAMTLGPNCTDLLLRGSETRMRQLGGVALGAAGQEVGRVMTDTHRTTQQHDTGANCEGPDSGGRKSMVFSRNNVAKVPSLNATGVWAPLRPLRGQNLITAIDKTTRTYIRKGTELPPPHPEAPKSPVPNLARNPVLLGNRRESALASASYPVFLIKKGLLHESDFGHFCPPDPMQAFRRRLKHSRDDLNDNLHVNKRFLSDLMTQKLETLSLQTHSKKRGVPSPPPPQKLGSIFEPDFDFDRCNISSPRVPTAPGPDEHLRSRPRNASPRLAIPKAVPPTEAGEVKSFTPHFNIEELLRGGNIDIPESLRLLASGPLQDLRAPIFRRPAVCQDLILYREPPSVHATARMRKIIVCSLVPHTP